MSLNLSNALDKLVKSKKAKKIIDKNLNKVIDKNVAKLAQKTLGKNVDISSLSNIKLRDVGTKCGNSMLKQLAHTKHWPKFKLDGHFSLGHFSGGSLGKFGLNMPGVHMPNFHLPSFHLPKFGTSGGSSFHMPSFHMPNFHMPNFHLPKFGTPGASSFHLPNFHMPHISLPKFSGGSTFHMPDFHLPKLGLPKLNIPHPHIGGFDSFHLPAINSVFHGLSLPKFHNPFAGKTLLDLDLPDLKSIHLSDLKIDFLKDVNLPDINLSLPSIPLSKLGTIGLDNIRLDWMTLDFLKDVHITDMLDSILNFDLTLNKINIDLNITLDKFDINFLKSLDIPNIDWTHPENYTLNDIKEYLSKIPFNKIKDVLLKNSFTLSDIKPEFLNDFSLGNLQDWVLEGFDFTSIKDNFIPKINLSFFKKDWLKTLDLSIINLKLPKFKGIKLSDIKVSMFDGFSLPSYSGFSLPHISPETKDSYEKAIKSGLKSTCDCLIKNNINPKKGSIKKKNTVNKMSEVGCNDPNAALNNSDAQNLLNNSVLKAANDAENCSKTSSKATADTKNKVTAIDKREDMGPKEKKKAKSIILSSMLDGKFNIKDAKSLFKDKDSKRQLKSLIKTLRKDPKKAFSMSKDILKSKGKEETVGFMNEINGRGKKKLAAVIAGDNTKNGLDKFIDTACKSKVLKKVRADRAAKKLVGSQQLKLLAKANKNIDKLTHGFNLFA